MSLEWTGGKERGQLLSEWFKGADLRLADGGDCGWPAPGACVDGHAHEGCVSPLHAARPAPAHSPTLSQPQQLRISLKVCYDTVQKALQRANNKAGC